MSQHIFPLPRWHRFQRVLRLAIRNVIGSMHGQFNQESVMSFTEDNASVMLEGECPGRPGLHGRDPGYARILIMDDEEVLLDIASQICRRLGLEVTTATNGTEALEHYRGALRQGKPYDLVLLDMNITGGKGGIETAAALHKIDPRVKAVVMSGYSDHEVMVDPVKYGFSAVLEKPFRLQEFIRILETVIPSHKLSG